jgi:hypothetical protein
MPMPSWRSTSIPPGVTPGLVAPVMSGATEAITPRQGKQSRNATYFASGMPT